MTEEELLEAVFPHVSKRMEYLDGGGRLVHYTSAETVHKILTGRVFWLRNAQLMNDFSEIQHGLQCLAAGLHSDWGGRLKALLDELDASLWERLVSHYDERFLSYKVTTFLTSFSEHYDQDDRHGRLSMWRAYGGNNGAALVFNPTIFTSRTEKLGVALAPVEYLDTDDFVPWFGDWVTHLHKSRQAILQLDPERVLSVLSVAFRIITLCTKHPAFAEEREWRVFWSPAEDDETKWLSREEHTIGGTPQTIIALKLEDDADEGINGLAPPGLINRIMIGPCEHPSIIRQVLTSALEATGAAEPNHKVFALNIPLHHR